MEDQNERIEAAERAADIDRRDAINGLVSVGGDDAPHAVEVTERLGVSIGSTVPQYVGDALVGVPMWDGEVNHLLRLFVDGDWMLNTTFASDPEFVDVFIGSDFALVVHNGNAFVGDERTYLSVNRDQYNEFFEQLLNEDGEQVLLPSGGLDVEWRDYDPYDCKIPTLDVEGEDARFSPFFGFDDELVTEELVERLIALPTVTECLHGEYRNIREDYEELIAEIRERSERMEKDSTNRRGLVYGGVQVTDPSDTFEAFISWSQRRGNWSLNGDYEGAMDVLEEETSGMFCPLQSHNR